MNDFGIFDNYTLHYFFILDLRRPDPFAGHHNGATTDLC